MQNKSLQTFYTQTSCQCLPNIAAHSTNDIRFREVFKKRHWIERKKSLVKLLQPSSAHTRIPTHIIKLLPTAPYPCAHQGLSVLIQVLSSHSGTSSSHQHLILLTCGSSCDYESTPHWRGQGDREGQAASSGSAKDKCSPRDPLVTLLVPPHGSIALPPPTRQPSQPVLGAERFQCITQKTLASASDFYQRTCCRSFGVGQIFWKH